MPLENDSWRIQRDERNLRAYLEWERERAAIHREFAKYDAYEMLDAEPEERFVTAPRKRTKRKP